MTDTEGNLVHAVVHTADIQDRDGAPLLLAEIVRSFPWLRHVFADGGYAGKKLRVASAPGSGSGPSRSSNGPTGQRASKSCRDAGWSSGHSPGSAATVALQRTSNRPSHRPLLAVHHFQLLTRRIVRL